MHWRVDETLFGCWPDPVEDKEATEGDKGTEKNRSGSGRRINRSMKSSLRVLRQSRIVRRNPAQTVWTKKATAAAMKQRARKAFNKGKAGTSGD